MRVGADITTVIVSGAVLRLRPALRHGLALEAKWGFPKLIEAVQQDSLSAALDLIGPHTARDDLGKALLVTGLHTLRWPLFRHVMFCAGLDPDDTSEPEAKPKGKPITFADHLASLYRHATGWLGWPPEVALDATPAQIMEAMQGRTDLLKALFGSTEETPKPPADLARKAKDTFKGLGTVKAKRKKKVAT